MANTTQNASKADSQNSSDYSRGAAPSNPIVVNPGSVTTGALQEDTTLSATGSIGITDSNAGATQTWSLKGDAKGTYGALALDITGRDGWVTRTLGSEATWVIGEKSRTAS